MFLLSYKPLLKKQTLPSTSPNATHCYKVNWFTGRTDQFLSDLRGNNILISTCPTHFV